MHNEAWTPEIDALAVRLRRDERLSAKVIAARLNRTPGAVSARLLKLGVTIHDRAEWDAAETDRLRELLADRTLSVRGVAKALGRTECSVRWKADDLGIKPGRLRAWTADEDARVLAVAGRPEIALRAAAAEIDRTYEALRARLVALGVRTKETWDRAVVRRLRALVADGGTADAVAADLDREVGAVKAKAYSLGLRFPANPDLPRAWTPEEDRRLSALAVAGGLELDAVGKAMGRSARAVRRRLRTLGLTTATARGRALDDEARAAVVDSARSGEDLTVAARRLGRDPRTLRAVAAEAGVKFVPAERPARPTRVRTVATRASAPARSYPVSAGERAFATTRPRVATAAASRRAEVRNADTVAIRASMDDAIARFIREKGVTRAGADSVEETIRRVRIRGYAVTGNGAGGYLVDGRHALPDADALREFASARGIEVAPLVTAG